MSKIVLGPVGVNPRGTYNYETHYERLDVVLYQGTSFVAKQDVINVTPVQGEFWDALGISGADLSEYYTKSEVDEALEEKYEKPQNGIPKTDLSSSVQTSLDKADSALQQHQDISGKEDSSNKVIAINSSSTDTQYPSAKCVYDLVGDVETLLTTLNTGNGV